MQIKTEVQKYIKRSFLLHRKGNPKYYNTASRLGSLDKLRIMESCLSWQTERSIARMVILNEHHLRNVLPYHTNLSHIKTREKLEKIISRCKTETILSYDATRI